MRAILRLAAVTLCLTTFGAGMAMAQYAPPPGGPPPGGPPPGAPPAAVPAPAGPPPARHSQDTFRPEEIVREGHRFFGTVSRGLAGSCRRP
jgi:hypothetical protein